MRIFVDIETVPDQTPGALEKIKKSIKPPGNITKPDSIQKWIDENSAEAADKKWRDTALDWRCGEIICIGFAIENMDTVTLYRGDYLAKDEKELLYDFWDVIEEYIKDLRSAYVASEWVGHNLLGFDARFLLQRSLKYRIKPTAKLDPLQRHGSGHMFDTMIQAAGFKGYVSLDDLCQLYGIASPKTDMDGSQVYDRWIEGGIKDIAEYCMKDVNAVREIYKIQTLGF